MIDEFNGYMFDSTYYQLMNEMKKARSVEISEFADEPVLEEKFIFTNCSYIESSKGYMFMLNLRNEESDKEVNLAVDHVVKIEPGNFGSDFSKYYFKCIDMKELSKLIFAEKCKAKPGIEFEDVFYKHRIVLHF